jgi:hypothetical protein
MKPAEKNSDHPAWLAQARDLLDESAQALDAATLSRLNRARQAALEQRHRRLPRPWFLSAGLASACVLLLAMAVWHVRTPGPVATGPALSSAPAAASSSFSSNDMDMVSSDDSLELYQDLEFYAWLEAQDQDSDG